MSNFFNTNFMIITIFGATGQVGSQVVKQALAKGYKVKAFGRNVESLIDKDLRDDNFEAVKGYVFDEKDVLNAVKNVDAVVSCLGGAFDGIDKTRSLGIKNIVHQIEKANIKRIIAIGGLGVLNIDDETLLMDTPEYPETYKPVSLEHLAALKTLETSSLDWTFICPPNILDKDFTGNYSNTENLVPENNKGEINAGDLADFILKAIEKNQYLKTKVGITKA